MKDSFLIALKPGDNDPLSWIVTALYFITCWLCLKAAGFDKSPSRLFKRNGTDSTAGFNQLRNSSSNSRFWLCIATVIFVLGVNKQADFQSFFDLLAKQTVRTLGWQEYRSQVKIAFILFLACSLLLAAFFVVRTVARWNTPVKIAIAGVFCHACFIFVRGASFYVSSSGRGLNSLSLVFESIGLICISIAATLEWKSS